MKATVSMTCEVEIEIPDDLVDKVFGPPVENQDEDGNPVVPGGPELRGWRDFLYNLDSVDKVLEHLAYASAFNNSSMHQMEGWLFEREDSDRVIMRFPDIYDYNVTITEDSPALDRYRRTA